MTPGQIALLAAYGLAVWFLRGYLAEKGKGLATKEDIEELTHKVESVRSSYAADLERMRSDLSRSEALQKARYDTELRFYEEIWERLVAVQVATEGLDPLFGPPLNPGQTEEGRRQRRLNDFATAFNAFVSTVENRKPFYPVDIYQHLNDLRGLVHREAIGYQHRDGPRSGVDEWRELLANRQAIGTQIDATCTAIRSRLSSPRFD